MLTSQEVKSMIVAVLPDAYLEVKGDGAHFFATIVSASFADLSRLERHRLVKKLLAPKIASNELHALSLQGTFTPAEWQKRGYSLPPRG